MRTLAKSGIAVLAILAFAVGGVWGQNQAKPKITVANYQMEPTPPGAELLKLYGDKFGAEFEVVNIDNDRFHEILNIKLAAGEIPDFLYLKQADTLGNYIKQGVLAKIPMDLIKKNAPALLKTIETYAPGYMAMGSNKGAQYGIPAVSPTNILHIPLVYRSDWMKKVGVTKVPTTLAEFESLMYKFANNDPDGNGKKDTYGLSKDGLNAVFGAFGVVPYDHSSSGGPGTDYWMLENGKVINASISSGTKQALTLLAKWYKAGVIDPEFITGENQGGYWALSHAFIKGRIGFTSRANYYHWAMPGVYNEIDAEGKKYPNQPGAVAKEFIAANPEGTLVLGQSIKGPTGKQGIKMFNRLMNFVTIGRPVEKDPVKMAKILQVLNESANPDFVARTSLKYGPEGKYWKLLDLETESFNFIPPYDKDLSYWSRIGGELSMALPFPPKAAREQWGFSLGYDKAGIESLIQIGLPTAVKFKNDLMKLRDETYIAIITGAKPISAFDEFVKNYLAAGGKQAQDEANDYYNETIKK